MEISPAAWFERSASLRTSSATTANPMPCSPARAASMAAFRASRFVWLAISEITWMISAICCELVRISSMASIDFCTAAPPCFGQLRWSRLATLSASWALSLTRFDRAGQFFDRGGHLLDARALGLGPGGQRLRAFGDHARAFVELGGALGDLADDAGKIVEHLLDAGGQLVDGLVALDLDLLGQVALGGGVDDLEQIG